MVITPDDQYLLTASEDSSVLIWRITDQERQTLAVVKEIHYTEEVLCTKAYVEEKVNMTISCIIFETDGVMFPL